MLNRVILKIALASLLGFSLNTVYASDNWKVSSTRLWQLNELKSYQIAKGSASKLLSADEAYANYEAKIKVNKDLINSYTFSLSCALESATPIFILKVPPLDIPMQDSLNGYVFARFLVDDRNEVSLRGEVYPRGKIIFAPITNSQTKKISDLYLQLNDGGNLKIALLQGKTANPRFYDIPLAGINQYTDKIVQNCVLLNKKSPYKTELLEDYVTKEPDSYAPTDFTLKDKDGVDDPNAPQEIVDNSLDTSNQNNEEPIVHEFTPDGSVASIGPDGKPIMNNSNANSAGDDTFLNQAVNTGPLKIDANGLPIVDDATESDNDPLDANDDATASDEAVNSQDANAQDTSEDNGNATLDDALDGINDDKIMPQSLE